MSYEPDMMRLVVNARKIGNAPVSTARKGDKWLKNIVNDDTYRLAVVNRSGKFIGVADVLAVAYCPLDWMEDTSELIDGTPPGCNEEDYVTVITFQMENVLEHE